jgi:hypothetical protein
MTTITTRVDKGSPLTIEELDDNFINLSTDIVALQANAQAQRVRKKTLQTGEPMSLEIWCGRWHTRRNGTLFLHGINIYIYIRMLHRTLRI